MYALVLAHFSFIHGLLHLDWPAPWRLRVMQFLLYSQLVGAGHDDLQLSSTSEYCFGLAQIPRQDGGGVFDRRAN